MKGHMPLEQNQNSTITVEPAFKDTIQEEEQRQSIESGSALSQNIIDQEKLTSVPKNMLLGDKIREIGGKLPGRLSAVKSSDAEEPTGKEEERLREIDKYVRRIAGDRNRMSGYRKVVKAAQLYLAAEKKSEKAVALNALLESARIYLTEGSNKSYGVGRKDLCRDLISSIGQYETARNEKHKSPALMSGAEYLVSGGELSDEMIDQEIRIAYARIKGNKKFLGMSENKRREAFKRKIREMRRARQISSEIKSSDDEETAKLNRLVSKNGINDAENTAPGYAGAVIDCVKAYMTFYREPQNMIAEQKLAPVDMPPELLRALLSGDDNGELQLNKGKVLEAMLYQVLSWDLNEFAFSKPEEFLRKETEGKFKELYRKLEFAANAEYLLSELTRLGENKLYQTGFAEKQLKELRSRISLLSSVEKEYRTRLELMSSPYYALLLQEDITDPEITAQLPIREKDTRDAEGAYEEAYRKVLAGRKKIAAADGAYIRGTAMSKLKKTHDRKFRIRADYRDHEPDQEKKNESERMMMSILYGQKEKTDAALREKEEQRKAEERKRLEDEKKQREEEDRKKREADLKKQQEEEQKQREADLQKQEEDARARYVKDRKDRAKAAADSGEKDAMFAMIGELTGMDTALIADLPADKLQEILRDLGELAALDTAALEGECRERVDLVRKGFTEEYLQESFFKYKGEVDRLEEKDKAPVARSGKKDYALMYLKKMLSIDGKELESFDADRLYTMAKDFSLIRRLSRFNDPEYEEDLKRSVGELYALDIPQELKDKMGELLKVKIEKAVLPEKTYEVLKGVKTDKDYKKNTELFRERKTEEPVFDENLKMKEQTAEYRKHLKVLKEGVKNKKKKDAPKTRAAAAAWSKEALGVLGLAGDAVECLIPGASEQEKALALQKIFRKNAKVLKAAAEAKQKKKDGDPFSEIFKNITNEQRTIFDELRTIVNELVSKCEKSGMTMEKFLASDMMTPICSAAAGQLEGVLTALEAEVEAKMDLVTTNIFDQVEGMGMLPLIDDLDSADATKEQKEQEGVRKLDYMQNELLYDRERGQGKFMELLTSGYFKNATPENRRFMLSYIVRDMRKKTEDGTDAQLGGHYFASAMKGAGPLMQKMIQGLPERMVVPEMKEAVMVVKSSLRPIDAEYKEKVFERMKKDSKNKILEIKELRSLGAASVAETFLCEVTRQKGTVEKVVVKIKRPDAVKRMNDEFSFIKKCSRDADFSYEEQEYLADKKGFAEKYAKKHDMKDAKEKKRYREITESAEKKVRSIGVTESGFQAQFSAIEKEFDFKNELANAKRGEINYIEKKRNVNTVKINESFKADADYIVMNLAEGKTVDNYIRDTRDATEQSLESFQNEDRSSKDKHVLTPYNVTAFDLERKAMKERLDIAERNENLVSQLAYQWIKMAIFGSSAISINGENFHHGDLHSGNIMIGDNGTTVLDYGNATVLLDDKVTQILGMMTAVAANRTDFFVDAFDELLGLAEAEDEKLEGKPGYVGYSRMSLAQKTEYEKKLKEIFALGSGKDAGKKILLSLSIAQEMGLKLPREIQNFSQCQQRLENSVLEVKDLAVGIAQTLQKSEYMPVDPRYKDVPDAVLMLHNMMNVKNGKGEYVNDRRKAYGKVLGDFVTDSADRIVELANKLDGSEESCSQFRSRFLPGYPGIKEDPIFKNRADFPKVRETFYKVRSFIDKGEAVPAELEEELEKAKQKFSMDMLTSEILSKRGECDHYVRYVNDALSNHEGYDVESFEMLEYMLEEFAPRLLAASESMDAYLDAMQKGGKKEIAAAKEAFVDAARSMEASNVSCTAPLRRLKKNVTSYTTREEEAELETLMGGVNSASMGAINDTWAKFKKKKKLLEEARGIADQESLEKAQKEYDKALDDFLVDYGKWSVSMLNDHMSALTETEVDPAYYMDNDNLPDFVTQMATCLSNHFIRAGGKLGLKYKDELARLKRASDDAERKEKGIEKTEEQIKADKKADEAYKEYRRKYVSERDAELKKLETAYQNKLRNRLERKEKEAASRLKDAQSQSVKIGKLKEKLKKKGGQKTEKELKEAEQKYQLYMDQAEALRNEAEAVSRQIAESTKK